MKLPIYMDCHATTPVDPRVLDAMLPYFREHFGNASSSTHSFGWAAEEAVSRARAQVAELIGAEPREIVFTGGATESNSLALRGAAQALRERGDHIVTTAVEHKSVLGICKRLEGEGFRVTYLPVRSDGIVDPAAVAAALEPRTILISVMAANNEIGTLEPLAEIGALARAHDVVFHTDAAQALGKIPLDVESLQLDLLSFSAHKLYGPKGVGGLYVRRRGRRVRLEPQTEGGGQERGLRSGTLNVPGIVGAGAACAVARQELAEESERLRGLRDRLLRGIGAALDGITVNGSLEHRLPGNLNVSFTGVLGESLLMGMNDVALSPGSACDSGTSEPSHVMRALGVSADLARSSVRFGLGRFNTEEEVDYVVEKLARVVRRLREQSPLYASGGTSGGTAG